ncbi:hypothetical protein SAMN02746089_02168 [Caldanaerobius fijiensis DSM 17918]|uniref:Uncharacterized protein n=1 Tax=Caldanaerobius fijiensis DSM 17918 TaxID=1121256 RepID=A0A1M5CP39_9THEO|nr:NusG domain II-containing protein [Caldanaerobius fijiensis]SHF56470.1 hypothetical protein SAMN02746089_02168 [Caldanaerobius fijiensis DSM 17918]
MKKGDIVVALFMAILAVVLLGFYNITSNRHYAHKYAVITVDGKFYKKVSLDDTNYQQKIPVVTKYGKDILMVKDGGIKVIYAECPDKICIKEGFIDKPGQSIVCLPFRIVVEIKGEKNAQIDQVVY